MTKRLTPEEDAGAVGWLGNRGIITGDADGSSPWAQIDKQKYEIEFTREGERFLEVRFKRRESVTETRGGSPVSLEGNWGGIGGGIAQPAGCSCEICQRNRAIKISDGPVSYAEARAVAERVLKADGR